MRTPIKMNQSQAALKRELLLHLNTINVSLTQLHGLTIIFRKFKASQKLSSKKSNLRKKKKILELRKGYENQDLFGL